MIAISKKYMIFFLTIKSILKTEINWKMKHIKNTSSQSNQNGKTRFAKTSDNFFSSNFLTQQIFSNYSTLSQTQISTETNPSHYKGKVARMEVRFFLIGLTGNVIKFNRTPAN